MAVRDLDRHLDSLKAAARDRLGRLFDPADYPVSLFGQFDLSWEFPSVEPPDYLRRLHPELYREECRRARARFDEAVALAEAAFTEELTKLVERRTRPLPFQVGPPVRAARSRFPPTEKDMTRRHLDRAVARATGETQATIRRLGFGLAPGATRPRSRFAGPKPRPGREGRRGRTT